jgi:hypothetical protein
MYNGTNVVKVAARAENAYDFFLDFAGFPTKIIAPGAAVGCVAGALAGSTVVERGAFAFWYSFWCIRGPAAVPVCALLGVGSWHYTVEWCCLLRTHPVWKKICCGGWNSTKPTGFGLAACRHCCCTSRRTEGRHTPQKRFVKPTQANAALKQPKRERMQRSASNTGAKMSGEAEKARLVKIVPTEKDEKTPIYLYTSDAEELCRVAEVAETVAKFRGRNFEAKPTQHVNVFRPP